MDSIVVAFGIVQASWAFTHCGGYFRNARVMSLAATYLQVLGFIAQIGD